MWKYLIARIAEPSTWAGLATAGTQVASAVATHNPVSIAVTVAGIVAALIPEQSGAAA